MTCLQFVAFCALSTGCMSSGIQPRSPALETLRPDPGAGANGSRTARFSEEFLGMHTLSPTRHWPTVPFEGMRPAGVSWGALEPMRGKYDWRSLDSWVTESQGHGAQLDYVFLNTPRWASTRPSEPCSGGRSGCAAPPNLKDWEDFVSALVTRYKGRISSYELWNEPNASSFWSGSPEQMAELAAHAYPLVKSIDPAAVVTTPSASSTGWPLAHDAWLDRYLSAGGGRYADVVAWHGYAGRNDRPALPPEDLARQIQALRSTLERHHLSQLPIWDTEGGWGKDAQLPDEDEQASFLIKWYAIQFTSGIERAYWYQWDNPEWGTLWREGTGLTPAGAAYLQVAGWLEDATPASPCRPVRASTLWTCDLRKKGALYRIAWSTSGKTPFATMDRVVGFTEAGHAQQASDGQPVMVGSRPVLFQMREQGTQ
jgi:hypothetical protein